MIFYKDNRLDKLRVWWLELPEWLKWLTAPFMFSSIFIITLIITVLAMPIAVVTLPFWLSRLILSSVFDEGL